MDLPVGVLYSNRVNVQKVEEVQEVQKGRIPNFLNLWNLWNFWNFKIGILKSCRQQQQHIKRNGGAEGKALSTLSMAN